MLHGGVLVESVDARVKNLRQTLSKYISDRFTGYIVYRSKDIQLVIGLANGNIALCRSIKYIPVHLESAFGETRRKTIVDGAECCEDVGKLLDESKGSIEVYRMDYNVLLTNVIITPQAKVETSVPLAKMLKTDVGISKPLVTLPQVTPPVPETALPKIPETKPPIEAPTKPPLKPEVETPPPPLRREVRIDIKEMTVEECIDPVTLYKVIRSSQLEEFIETASIEEILGKIRTINDQKKPSFIYISGTLENQTVKILFSPQTYTINIEVEKKETSICGKSAVNIIQEKGIKNARIWTMK